MGEDAEQTRAYLQQGLWEPYRQVRRPWLRQVEENVRNLAGRQYDLYLDNLGEFVNLSEVFVPNDERWRRAPVFNWLAQVWFLQSLSKLTENVPNLTALPSTGDNRDSRLAAVWDAVWKYEWRQMGMQELAFQHYGWILTAGESVLYLKWDPDRGDSREFYGPASLVLPDGTHVEAEAPYVVGDDGQMQPALLRDPAGNPIIGPNGRPVIDPTARAAKYRQGDLACEVVCPTSVLYPYGPWPHYESPWVMREKLMDVDEVYRRFRVEVEPEAQSTGDDLLLRMEYQSPYLNPSSAQDVLATWAGTSGSVVSQNLVRVREFWSRPTERRYQGSVVREDDGRVIMVTDTATLYDGPNPYCQGPHGSCVIPFHRFRRPAFPFRQEGLTDLESLIPVARARNRARAGLLDAADMNNQPIRIVNQALVADDQIKHLNEAGGTLRVDGPWQEAVGFLQPPGLPPAVAQLDAMLSEELNLLGGIGVSAGGKPVTGDASGELQREVRFDSDRPWGATLRLHSYEWERVGHTMLKILAACCEESRLLAISGDDTALRFVDVQPELFAGSVHLHASPESAVLESRFDKQQRVTNILLTAGQLGKIDPALAQTFLSTLQFPDISRAMRPNSEAYALAQREVAEILQTRQLPPVLPEQDHATHVQVVATYMTSMGFRDLPPEVQQVLRVYRRLHELAGQQMALEQMGEQLQQHAAMAQAVAANAPNNLRSMAPPAQPGPSREGPSSVDPRSAPAPAQTEQAQEGGT